ncbi:MAG: cytochrome C [Gemmatimonadetes bacterium]|nr:MAG: cytochrome C [Gemmatimonadota bacterium]
MAQTFPKWTNKIPLVLIFVLVFGSTGAAIVYAYYFSPAYTDVGYRPEQPVPYSHKLHAGDLGMDCRYCHTNVEVSQEANVPPTQTCMNCHTLILPESEKLLPVRESWNSGNPIEWVRVHNLADYVYFDHSAHLQAGVGCSSCHGRVDQMVKVTQVEPLSMAWCLDCHRNPDMHLRDLNTTSVTDMTWQPPANQLEIAARLKKEKNIAPGEDCSICHR